MTLNACHLESLKAWGGWLVLRVGGKDMERCFFSPLLCLEKNLKIHMQFDIFDQVIGNLRDSPWGIHHTAAPVNR